MIYSRFGDNLNHTKLSISISNHGRKLQLTIYMAHAEMFGRINDKEHVLEWGGEYSDHDGNSRHSWTMPNWWFRTDTDFAQAAYPTHIVLLPETL